MSAGERFTAVDVARFCSVDLKTIHNWAAKGKLHHARTAGGHLRFRRIELVEFLRAYAYPIPQALRDAKPRVVIADDDGASLAAARRALSRRFDVTAEGDAVAALVAVGARDPDVLVLEASMRGVDVPRCVATLGAQPKTSHLRVVLVAGDESARDAALRAGAAGFATKAPPAKLRDLLEELTGLSRT